MKTKDKDILKKVKKYIVELRQDKNSTDIWLEFKSYTEQNIAELTEQLDTRWLVSIADTFVDYGDPVESRNALLISIVVNFEKLWDTYLYMHDIQINEKKRAELIHNTSLPLWDGMYTFNIEKGDMTNNLFTRIDQLLAETPMLKKIFDVVIQRLNQNKTVFGELNQYHRDFYGKPPKRSILKSFLKRIRIFLQQYKLPLF